MGRRYSRKETLDRVIAATADMSNFYKNNFVNWTGKTSDTNQYYTEIIAEYLLNNYDLFNQIKPVTRKKSYKKDTHKCEYDTNSNRDEEVFAISMRKESRDNNKVYKGIGYICDYQVPLKDRETDRCGKIDLLAYDDKENRLKILELKKILSAETMLRCILEGYTYLKVVNKEKLIKDFGFEALNPELSAYALVFAGSNPYIEYFSKKDERANLIALMNKLGVGVYTLDKPVFKIDIME